MFSDLNPTSCDELWSVVYSFFHPELRTTDEGIDESVDLINLLSGLASEAAGFGKSARKERGANSFPFHQEHVLGAQAPATLVYEAYGVTERDKYWRAEIALTTALPIGDKVVVSVTDADGVKIPQAKLVLLGSELSVFDGLAAYDLDAFQTDLERTDVSLVYPSGITVEGTLKFGFGI